MILLNTNVVSEPLRPAPDARVIEWIDAQPVETIFLSAITVAELRAGVALLPAGKRRSGLQQSLEKRVLPLFAGRMLPFDLACTKAYAELMAKARAAGFAIATADGYTASSIAVGADTVLILDNSTRAHGAVTGACPHTAFEHSLTPAGGCAETEHRVTRLGLVRRLRMIARAAPVACPIRKVNGRHDRLFWAIYLGWVCR